VAAVERFLSAKEFPADIEGKSGTRRVDIRPLFLGLDAADATLTLRLALKPGATLRVNDFLLHGLSVPREEIVLFPICRNRFLMHGNDEVIL
jgi:hypothetical protein